MKDKITSISKLSKDMKRMYCIYFERGIELDILNTVTGKLISKIRKQDIKIVIELFKKVK